MNVQDFSEVYRMLDVVERSHLDFDYTTWDHCICGIAWEEGFFGWKARIPLIGWFIKQNHMFAAKWRYPLNLTEAQFDYLFTYNFPGHLAKDKEGACRWVREKLAEWNYEQVMADLATKQAPDLDKRLHKANMDVRYAN